MLIVWLAVAPDAAVATAVIARATLSTGTTATKVPLATAAGKPLTVTPISPSLPLTVPCANSVPAGTVAPEAGWVIVIATLATVKAC